jgi:hypothetical protein
MKSPVWCEFVCDECSATANGAWSIEGKIPWDYLQRAADGEGFVFKANGDVFCRQCAKHFEETKEPK